MATTAETLEIWCSASGINFVSDTARANYLARTKRISDVIQLKKPDRVPIIPSFSMYPAISNGISVREAMYEPKKAAYAWIKTMETYEPDAMMPPILAYPGTAFEILKYVPLKLPGKDVPANSIYQIKEKEYISAEDFYDAYLEDPTAFMLKKFFPSVFKTLEPLKALPQFANMYSYNEGILYGTMMLAQQDIVGAFQKWIQAGRIVTEFLNQIKSVSAKMAAMGYPNLYGCTTTTPFDWVGDWFRGTRGVMIDMHRYPEKLKSVMARRVPYDIEYGLSIVRNAGTPVVGLMLHKGSTNFLSIKQFEEFYWPGLKEVMLGIIDAGYIPMPLFEGNYNYRLDILKDIPKGKAIYWFEEIDIYEAKKKLGDRVCIRGNVPGTLLQFGTPQEVADYVKELIDVFGRDGGLIVDCGMWFDQAKHENLKAMIDTTKTYGTLK